MREPIVPAPRTAAFRMSVKPASATKPLRIRLDLYRDSHHRITPDSKRGLPLGN